MSLGKSLFEGLRQLWSGEVAVFRRRALNGSHFMMGPEYRTSNPMEERLPGGRLNVVVRLANPPKSWEATRYHGLNVNSVSELIQRNGSLIQVVK